MKQIRSTRLMLGTVLLFVSTSTGLFAQTEVASLAMVPKTLPVNSLLSVTPNTSVEAPSANSERSAQTVVAPGTLANSTAPSIKPPHKSAFSVEPDYLPSWITNQPYAYLQYGAVPAVATLHFGRK